MLLWPAILKLLPVGRQVSERWLSLVDLLFINKKIEFDLGLVAWQVMMYNYTMDFEELIKITRELYAKYAESDKKRLGKEWDRGEYAKALAADVGALIKLTMVADGLRDVENLDEKMKHEFGDCLLALVIIADKYGVDIEQACKDTAKELHNRASLNELAKSHSL
ncbi:hypothetical protein COT52_00150 [candidate division WWE3 bacterium CG08_land_8_20_14_0_20_43_13]|uniref:NTP pyrophosphohydrolase MazG putative catalytic core domain-containing protein n=1 Tax=candidate division WWE3 bacterium CG08_land_8_20_14_0_20_43_13 TaxID=1975087 RepID=A0A2H0X870_UNCKA|nr:MAG: hypothetical protein COT52_00150 [candidate division WWE3 bacterium CG08_land_8_20_14_0_20_43_13]